MALGGGTFYKQNKILPGSYINFVSAARAAEILSERGYAAMPLFMDWGEEGEVFRLDVNTFPKDCKKVFGYDYGDSHLMGIRDLFKHARVLYGYRINGGIKAACDYAAARYSGTRGNQIKMVISKNENGQFLVKTLFDMQEADCQTVTSMEQLQDNDYVIFKRDAELAETAGMPLTGGTNKADITPADYQRFLDKIEGFSFHTLGCQADDEEVKDLFVQFTKRRREEEGVKFQTVLYHTDADYEGIISLENPVDGTADDSIDSCGLIYWVCGAASGCAVNASNTNKVYDGEYKPYTGYTQKQLEDAVLMGKFILHRVGNEVRVLQDINTLVTYTEEKSEDFSSNQTIRVLDQIGNDIAVLFHEKYLGKIPNDESGRVSFWNDVVTYYRELERIRAIEPFKADDIVVAKGEGKKSVTAICPVTPMNAMEQLYMTVIVQ